MSPYVGHTATRPDPSLHKTSSSKRCFQRSLPGQGGLRVVRAHVMSGDTLELVILLNCGLRTLLYFWGIGDLLCPDRSAQTQPQHAGVQGNTKSVLSPGPFSDALHPCAEAVPGFGSTLGTLLPHTTSSVPSTTSHVGSTSPQLLFAASCSRVCTRKDKTDPVYTTQRSHWHPCSLTTNCKPNL